MGRIRTSKDKQDKKKDKQRVYKALHRNLKIEEHEPTKNRG